MSDLYAYCHTDDVTRINPLLWLSCSCTQEGGISTVRLCIFKSTACTCFVSPIYKMLTQYGCSNNALIFKVPYDYVVLLIAMQWM